MNKKLVLGALGVLLFTGGYDASAQGLPGFHLTTTTYKPGTPPGMDYPGSPYEITGRTTQASTPATGAAASRTTHTASVSSPAPVPSPPVRHHAALTATVTAGRGPSVPGWTFYLFNRVSFAAKTTWRIFQDDPGDIMMTNAADTQGVNVDITKASVYGADWSYDVHHFHQFVSKVEGVPVSAMSLRYGTPANQWTSRIPGERPVSVITWHYHNQVGQMTITPYAASSVVYTGIIPPQWNNGIGPYGGAWRP